MTGSTILAEFKGSNHGGKPFILLGNPNQEGPSDWRTRALTYPGPDRGFHPCAACVHLGYLVQPKFTEPLLCFCFTWPPVMRL